MKILIIHNAYGRRSGEEAVVESTVQLLRDGGHQVVTYFRSSAAIPEMAFGQVRAFFAGINSPSARREVARLLDAEKPDVVNIHNLYPLISPAILPLCSERGIPVVMTVHNYRLVCPNGLLFSHGEVCERCLESGSSWDCVKRNCESSLPKSVGYALRNSAARRRRQFLDHVSHYALLTEFQKAKLVQGGLPAGRMTVIGNPVDPIEAGEGAGNYVVYVGRLSREKGVDLLYEAARSTDVPIKIAGSIRHGEDFGEPPSNVHRLGFVSGRALHDLIQKARFLVLPSRCYEGFPVALVEAMSCGRPVIAPNHGGIPEIVSDGDTGLLFQPGSADDLARCINVLWEDVGEARVMGAKAAEKAAEYAPDKYLATLMTVFDNCRRQSGDS